MRPVNGEERFIEGPRIAQATVLFLHMNILLLAVGSYGDVLPLVGLGREFLQQGHQVTMFANPYFAKVIQEARVQFNPIGLTGEFLDIINNPHLWHSRHSRKLSLKLVAPQLVRETYHAMRSHLASGSTILISSFLGWAARILQETHGIPHVSTYYAPSNFFSTNVPRNHSLRVFQQLPTHMARYCWSMINRLWIDPLVKPSLEPFRRKLHLPPTSEYLHGWAPSPDLVLGLFPEWFAPRQPDWPPNSVLTEFPLYDSVPDTPLPDAVQEFLGIYPHPIVWTPGTINKHGHRFFKEAMLACQQLGRPGLFLTRFPEHLPPSLPPSIQHFSSVPFSALLPHCAALVHHGGIGTCVQAMAAGIPQFIQPLAYDQSDNARRVEELGLGTTILPRFFHHSFLASKLQELLDSSDVQKQCRLTSQRVTASSGLANAYKVIESHFL